MNSEKQYDELINVLYETALDPSLWKEAMLLCSRQVNGIAAHIMSVDKTKKKPVFLVAAGDGELPDMENQSQYINYYVKIDPRMSVMEKASQNEWRFCSTYMDQQFVNHNEFYQDFLIPSGGRYAMGMWIDDCAESKTVLGLHRSLSQPAFSEPEKQIADRFIGHIQRALRLQRHTKTLNEKAELGARAIDSFSLSMIIVDSKAFVLHLNSEAKALIDAKQNGIHIKNNRLSADSPKENHKLNDLITQATSYPAIGGAMFFNCSNNPQTQQVFVTPLPASSPYAQDWQTPLALVLMMKPNQPCPSLQFLGKLYNFSPAEIKVCASLMQGKSPEEYALEAGVSVHTVRTQIKNLFRKTETNRQSELVALLCKIPYLKD